MDRSRSNLHSQKGDSMKKKELYTTLFFIILGLFSIYLFAILDIQLKESAQKAEIQKYNIYRTLEGLVLIIFGILIEYKKVIFLFKNGVFINKYYLITAIGLAILLVLPYEVIAKLGIGYPSSIKGTIAFIFNNINTRSILSVLTGIMFVRSLIGSEPNKKIFFRD